MQYIQHILSIRLCQKNIKILDTNHDRQLFSKTVQALHTLTFTRIDNIAFKKIAMHDGGSQEGSFLCLNNCIFVSLVGIHFVITPIQSQNALQKNLNAMWSIVKNYGEWSQRPQNFRKTCYPFTTQEYPSESYRNS